MLLQYQDIEGDKVKACYISSLIVSSTITYKYKYLSKRIWEEFFVCIQLYI